MQALQSYRESFKQHGDTPEGVQWSTDGQRFRFEKLVALATAEHGSLKGASILELGCGLGHFYEFLKQSYSVDYLGIDLVPEMIYKARDKHPEANFMVNDADSVLGLQYDYVFLSGVFNAPFRYDAKEFMHSVLSSGFKNAKKAMVFNFTSAHVNFHSEGANYYAPDEVFAFCLDNLSKKVALHHHYRNCDVAVYVAK